MIYHLTAHPFSIFSNVKNVNGLTTSFAFFLVVPSDSKLNEIRYMYESAWNLDENWKKVKKFFLSP